MDPNGQSDEPIRTRSVLVKVSRYRRAGGAVVRLAEAEVPVVRPGDAERGRMRRAA